MNITPDQADQWAKTATDGPWYVETDPDDPYGPFIYDDTGNMCISVEPVGSDYREADLHLAAAAFEGCSMKELARVGVLRYIDGMEWVA